MRIGTGGGHRPCSWLSGALACLGLAAAAGASDVAVEPAEGAAQVESADAAQGATGASRGRVERAAITTAVVDREPQDSVEALGNDHVEVSFFTELRGLEGQTVMHRWEHDGQVVAEVPMQVGGPRWRTYSTKRLPPEALGPWKASVVDASGRVLESRSFVYQDSAVADTGPAPGPAVPAAPAP